MDVAEEIQSSTQPIDGERTLRLIGQCALMDDVQPQSAEATHDALCDRSPITSSSSEWAEPHLQQQARGNSV